MLAFFKESLIGQYFTVFFVSMVPLIEHMLLHIPVQDSICFWDIYLSQSET